LIAVVIAFVPQSSASELIALHDAGKLEIISVGADSHVTPNAQGGCIYHYTDEAGQPVDASYATFIDSTGQRHLSLDEFPFRGLAESRAVIPARLKFKSPEAALAALAQGRKDIEQFGKEYYLKVPGIAITDDFLVVGSDEKANPRIGMMAVPYMGGYNPDYSGLDFCEEASARIIDRLLHASQ
jgi:hypothetical protein